MRCLKVGSEVARRIKRRRILASFTVPIRMGNLFNTGSLAPANAQGLGQGPVRPAREAGDGSGTAAFAYRCFRNGRPVSVGGVNVIVSIFKDWDRGKLCCGTSRERTPRHHNEYQQYTNEGTRLLHLCLFTQARAIVHACKGPQYLTMP